jgi:hypothetical protein
MPIYSQSARSLELTILIALLFGATPALGTTLSFDPSEIGEAAPQPADSESASGVTFGFDIEGSPDGIFYGVPEPLAGFTLNLSGGTLGGVSDPPDGIDSTDGILTLVFSIPVTEISFDLAVNVIGLVIDAATVDLGAEGSFSFDTNTMVVWSEGSFSWSGSAVSTAEVSFVDDPFISEFWLDNLSFTPIPEPGTGALLACGLLLLAGASRSGSIRRRSRPFHRRRR